MNRFALGGTTLYGQWSHSSTPKGNQLYCQNKFILNLYLKTDYWSIPTLLMRESVADLTIDRPID